MSKFTQNNFEASDSVLCIANIIEEGRFGGPQKRIALVGSQLKQHGVKTVVFLPKDDSKIFRSELDKEQIEWKALSMHRLGRGWKILSLYVATFWGDIWRIWRELRQGKYHALHVSGGVWQIKGAIAGRLAGVPVIWHLNDTQMPKQLLLVFKSIGWLADSFIVTASRVKKYYLDNTYLSKWPVYPIQAPVVTSRYDPRVACEDQEVMRFPFPRVVTIANVNPIKGLECLISATKILKKIHPNVSVIVVGPIYESQISYHKSLVNRIEKDNLENNIRFIGQKLDIPSVLKACDIFVCSSISESGPMSVWEAMAMGKPIVSTDVGDVAHYIKDKYNGFIVEVGDAKSMAERISQLITSKEMRLNFGERAREVAIEKLDIKYCAERHFQAYNQSKKINRK